MALPATATNPRCIITSAYDHPEQSFCETQISGSNTHTCSYDYAPFGNVTSTTAPVVPGNPFRSSIEYLDTDADLYYRAIDTTRRLAHALMVT